MNAVYMPDAIPEHLPSHLIQLFSQDIMTQWNYTCVRVPISQEDLAMLVLKDKDFVYFASLSDLIEWLTAVYCAPREDWATRYSQPKKLKYKLIRYCLDRTKGDELI